MDRLSKIGTELTPDQFFDWASRQHPRIVLDVLITFEELLGLDYAPGRAAYIVMDVVETMRAEVAAKHSAKH